MTKFDAEWAAAEEARRTWMAENSLYSKDNEHASCGVGLVVSIDGSRSRKVVEHGINALKAIWHRGAVDADGKTGDGAGIHVQIPVPFFYDQVERTGHTQHGRDAGGWSGVFAAHGFWCSGNLPDHR